MGKHKCKWKWWERYLRDSAPPLMTPEEIAEVCEDTADILEGHWVQGAWYVGENQSMCIEGAMAAALGLAATGDLSLSDFGDSSRRRVLLSCPVYRAVQDTLDLDSEDELPNWNDTDGRTEAEVVDVLRATAKRVLGVGPDQMRSSHA